jgi:hypothetical protein
MSLVAVVATHFSICSKDYIFAILLDIDPESGASFENSAFGTSSCAVRIQIGRAEGNVSADDRTSILAIASVQGTTRERVANILDAEGRNGGITHRPSGGSSRMHIMKIECHKPHRCLAMPFATRLPLILRTRKLKSACERIVVVKLVVPCVRARMHQLSKSRPVEFRFGGSIFLSVSIAPRWMRIAKHHSFNSIKKPPLHVTFRDDATT